MNIVIVGGGTAGWLAALIISKRCPAHDITVIESSAIGIIGAGEGSTGTLTNIVQNLTFDYGCDEKDFVKSCDVTAKLGIEFIDWSGDKTSYISPIDGSFTSNLPFDYGFCHAYSRFGKKGMHLCSEDGMLIESNLDTLSLDGGPAAYHFDAHKVGQYFKKVCGEKVKHIDDQVTEVFLDNLENIVSLQLESGQKIDGDFFIDASGFSRVLMNKLKNPWVSYKDHLPVDRAMPFLSKYKNNETIKPVTTAWAQNNGWMWQIPLLNRKGCGYVYSSEFVSDEQAKLELEKTIGEEIDPIRIIKFDSGRLSDLWVNNCLAIGLCAAFAEPLEATSIHTTIVQLENFAEYALDDTREITCNPSTIKTYNLQFQYMYDLLKDFLVAHYYAGRNDTEFWKYINQGNTLTEFTKEIFELAKIRSLNSHSFPPVAGAGGWPLWSFILAGTGNLSVDTVRKDLVLNRVQEFSQREFNRHKLFVENKNSNLQDNTASIRKRQKIF